MKLCFSPLAPAPNLPEMRTVKLSVTTVLLSVAVCFAPRLEAQPSALVQKTRHSLWKVQGEHCVVYLLGSIHVLKKQNYPLPAPIESAFANARVAVFETDIEALDDPKVALKIMNKTQLPEGETLRDRLSPEVYARFTNHLRKVQLPAAVFDRMTPVMAATSLAVLQMQRLGLDPEYGVDKHFFALAKSEGKEVVPLETVDFQISLLTDMSKEEGELIMKTTLRDMDKLEKDLGDLLKAWQMGDDRRLDSFLNEATQEAPLIYKRLLSDRNRNWLPKIEGLLRGNKTGIVIVGAGHLVGKEGLVALLKRKGFKVTQE
jgi:uncharacterized protein